ncbi:MAG TPA: DUF4382 domain-containing protein [Candidatus Acidoferrales bacterium]|nr:DUF4382 domain-containing protein [Candidatus Acidoferrales bacterium]
MTTRRLSRLIPLLFAGAVPFIFAGCNGSGFSLPVNNPTPQNGVVPMIVQDASTEDWATIGVKILSISLNPQGGGTAVPVYSAPSPAPMINLVQLDQLGEILGNLSVPVGTYTSATLTISANPGDLLLTAASDPEAGFAASAGATIPSNQIQIQGAKGSSGSMVVSVNVNLLSPLVVSTTQNNALDLEFDLAHPAFIVNHVPVGGGTTLWAVNFNGPVRHHPLADLTRLVLRHLYGSVTSVSSDNTAINVTKVFPVEPPTNPETSIPSTQSLAILADSANGTLFYDMDAKTVTTIKDFSSVSTTLAGKFVRIAARYQVNGTLVAVRVWTSTSFSAVWVSPEGHVLHVNASTDVVTIENESGVGVPLTVNSNTEFFFRTPWNAVADATPIATGTGFLTNKDLVRGFKVHASVVDPLATPLVAQTIDIEIAKYDGAISAANPTDFLYTHNFATASDDYNVTLPYIASTTANGKDSGGNVITGFDWWNLTFPTLLNSGANAITNFVAATNGSANFGGTAGSVGARGTSACLWNDPAAANTWSAANAVLTMSNVPLGAVSASWTNNSTGGSFSMSVPGGQTSVVVDASSVSGSATLVYQVDRTNGIVTITPQDLTTAAGLMNVGNSLVTGTPVKVFGIPQADGSIKAYVIFYYTGTKSTS